MEFTLSGMWANMGLFARVVVAIMGFMSLASLVVMFERIFAFMKSKSESVKYAEALAAPLGKGDLPGAAGLSVGKDIGHIGRVINAGLLAFKLAPADRDTAIESIARSLERQAAREVQTLKRGLTVLATVGSTAPFVGLMGTVMGIVNSFQSMAASGSGGLGTVSAGISEALITTAFGLIVAIPAVVAFNFLQGWIDARAVDMNESANEFLDVVAKHYVKG